MRKNQNYSSDIQLSEEVAKDKFDKHMKKARKDNIESRKRAFINLNEQSTNRKREYSNLESSVY